MLQRQPTSGDWLLVHSSGAVLARPKTRIKRATKWQGHLLAGEVVAFPFSAHVGARQAPQWMSEMVGLEWYVLHRNTPFLLDFFTFAALNYHFQSMPLPSPLSWYAHHLPTWVLRLSTVYANVCEIFLPFLFFIPNRNVHFTGFVCQVRVHEPTVLPIPLMSSFFQIFLQTCIVLTGNFNFSNLLIVALTVSLLDDQFFFNRRSDNRLASVLAKIFNFLVHGALIYAIVVLYGLKIKESHVDAHISMYLNNNNFGGGAELKKNIFVYTTTFSAGFYKNWLFRSRKWCHSSCLCGELWRNLVILISHWLGSVNSGS